MRNTTHLGTGDAKRRRRSDMNTIAAFISNRRGAAALECALGMVAMVSAWTLFFDLYQRADSQGVLMHTASTFADYASRDETVQAESLDDLAAFLHAQQFPAAKASFVVTAISKDASKTKPSALWTRTVTINPDDTDTTPLPTCSRVNGENNAITLPSVFTMGNGEIVIVAEVCTGKDDNATYAHYIVPTRSETSPTLEEEDDDSA